MFPQFFHQAGQGVLLKGGVLAGNVEDWALPREIFLLIGKVLRKEIILWPCY